MLRNLFVAGVAALLLQPVGADARGGHSSSHSTRSSSSHSTHITSHGTRSHHGSRFKRDPAQRRAFQHSHPCPANGHRSGASPGYVFDHKIPLKRGGLDRPSNMQWQTVAEAKAKDRWE